MAKEWEQRLRGGLGALKDLREALWGSCEDCKGGEAMVLGEIAQRGRQGLVMQSLVSCGKDVGSGFKVNRRSHHKVSKLGSGGSQKSSSREKQL